MLRRDRAGEVTDLTPSQRRLAASLIQQAQRYTATSFGHSRWEAFQNCETEHYLRHHARVRPKLRPRAPDIGTVVHIGLAAQALAAMRNLDVQLWQEAIRTCHRPPDIIAEAKRLLGGYFLQYGLENAGWGSDARIVGVEEYLAADLTPQRGSTLRKALSPRGDLYAPGPAHYSTRYDLIVEAVLPDADASGSPELALVDHKTAAHRVIGDAFGPEAEAACIAEFVKYARVDPQFLGQCWLYRERTGRVVPVVVNVLSKTKVPEYTRVVLRFTASDIDAWAENQRRIEAVRLPLMQDPAYQPLKNYGSCKPPIGSPCWAFDWCHGTEADHTEYYDVVTEENYENIVIGTGTEDQATGSQGEQVQVSDPDLQRKGRRKRRVLENAVDGAAEVRQEQRSKHDRPKADLHRKRRRS